MVKNTHSVSKLPKESNSTYVKNRYRIDGRFYSYMRKFCLSQAEYR